MSSNCSSIRCIYQVKVGLSKAFYVFEPVFLWGGMPLGTTCTVQGSVRCMSEGEALRAASDDGAML